MPFLRDTSIVSEVRKRHPNQQVLTWFRSVPSRDLYVGVLLLGEIRAGIERLRARDAERAAAHEAWLVRLVESYRERIFPVGAEISDRWGRLGASRSRPAVDTLMAATAGPRSDVGRPERGRRRRHRRRGARSVPGLTRRRCGRFGRTPATLPRVSAGTGSPPRPEGRRRRPGRYMPR
jgi:predicted nucleic acid-binding protein